MSGQRENEAASPDVLDCKGDLLRALAQPELSAFESNNPVETPNQRAAFSVAVALGRCCLFGVDAGPHCKSLPPRLALAAAEECSRQLRHRAEKAQTLATEWNKRAPGVGQDTAVVDLDGELEVTFFFFACLDLWAALVAIDEAYQEAVVAGHDSCASLRRAIGQTLTESQALDQAMQDNVDVFCMVGENSLLQNWYALLTEPYRSLVPWWFDGSLETANKCRKLRSEADSDSAGKVAAAMQTWSDTPFNFEAASALFRPVFRKILEEYQAREASSATAAAGPDDTLTEARADLADRPFLVEGDENTQVMLDLRLPSGDIWVRLSQPTDRLGQYARFKIAIPGVADAVTGDLAGAAGKVTLSRAQLDVLNAQRGMIAVSLITRDGVRRTVRLG